MMKPTSTFLLGLPLIVLLAVGCDSQTDLDPKDLMTDEERAFLTHQGIDADQRGFSYDISRAPVQTFADDQEVGQVRMVRFDDGVLATVGTSGLTPGTATTLWMVVFNAPAHCSDGACGGDDLRNPDVQADLLWVDGQVIDASGSARYLVFKRTRDTAGSIADPFLDAPAYGVADTRETEIHYVLRTHGPVIPGLEHEMTYTFNGGCQRGTLPDDPRLGPTGPNTCANLQFAIHLP